MRLSHPQPMEEEKKTQNNLHSNLNSEGSQGLGLLWLVLQKGGKGSLKPKILSFRARYVSNKS